MSKNNRRNFYISTSTDEYIEEYKEKKIYQIEARLLKALFWNIKQILI